MRCHGTTVTGKHCKLDALPGKDYCKTHLFSSIVVSVPCSSKNRDGGPCKHMTTRSSKCWQHLKKEDHLRVKKSPIAGLGLFATEPFAKGTNVAPYTGQIVVTDDRNFGGDHVLGIKRNTFIDARRTDTGVGRFANARIGQPNNAQLIYNARTRRAYVRARTDIPAGIEITVPYGAAYWRAVRARS